MQNRNNNDNENQEEPVKKRNRTVTPDRTQDPDPRTTFRWNTSIGWIEANFEGEVLVALDILQDNTLNEHENKDKTKLDPESPCALEHTKTWIASYLAGQNPNPNSIKIKLIGTPFQTMVWEELLAIPYGTSITYGALADKIAFKMGISKMSAQAIGGAVGKNPISIIVPCHRVIGAKAKLTGYGGGLPLKARLLDLEGIPYRW